MGKSYKKTPMCKDGNRKKKKDKKFAWKHVRALLKLEKEIPNHNGYKKCYESWNISDYNSRWTKEEAMQYYYKKSDPNSIDYSAVFVREYPTLEEFLKYWAKWYRNK